MAPSTVEKKTGFFSRLRGRLNSGNSFLTRDMGELLPGGQIDEDTLDELETRLLLADVGVEATRKIIDALSGKVKRRELEDINTLLSALGQNMTDILAPCAVPLSPETEQAPFVLLVVGVNGAGKTTTIGKLASQFQQQGKSVMLAAADTFRAAAVEQLQVWGERNQVPVIAQGTGADPAAVAHDALVAARSRGTDILIVDTAGRLHTQSNLMAELAKIKRVLNKQEAAAPHETMLVLDGSSGQNALVQAKQFHQALGITGLAITKLDGTAKGGVLLAIAQELALQIRYIGVGEQLDDLQPFNAQDFVAALLEKPEQEKEPLQD